MSIELNSKKNIYLFSFIYPNILNIYFFLLQITFNKLRKDNYFFL